MYYTKEFIADKLTSSDRWLIRGVCAIAERQTEDELESLCTSHHNGVGFNKVDAPILTGFAIQFKQDGYLNLHQLNVARARMLKYASQLARIANEKAHHGE